MDDELIEIVKSSRSWIEASRRLGCHPTTVMRRAKKLGIGIARTTRRVFGRVCQIEPRATSCDGRSPPRRRVSIPHDTLRRLYLEQYLGTAEIAARYACGRETVRGLLVDYGIPRRRRGRPAMQCYFAEPMGGRQRIIDRAGLSLHAPAEEDIASILEEIEASGCLGMDD